MRNAYKGARTLLIIVLVTAAVAYGLLIFGITKAFGMDNWASYRDQAVLCTIAYARSAGILSKWYPVQSAEATAHSYMWLSRALEYPADVERNEVIYRGLMGTAPTELVDIIEEHCTWQ